MRATINFDIDLDKVEDTMAVLVSQEAANLLITANILDNLGHGSLLHEVTEAVDLLQESASQLQQYKDMLISFEQAKYQTMLPQEAPFNPTHNLGAAPAQAAPAQAAPDAEPQIPLGDLVKQLRERQQEARNMSSFDKFIGRIREEDPKPEEESTNADLPPKG